jgi:transcriptional regulator with XRE-family HTH domain
MSSITPRKNLIGYKMRKLRYQMGLTQNDLSARIGRLGWDVSRATVSQIEAGLRCVTDFELVILATAVNAHPALLLPPQEEIKAAIKEFYPN